MVATTCERAAGSATKGAAYETESAHAQRRPEESAVRLAAHESPPCALSHSTWLAMRASDATAGVL